MPCGPLCIVGAPRRMSGSAGRAHFALSGLSTEFTAAVAAGDLARASALLSSGLIDDLNVRAPGSGATPLLTACSLGHDGLVRLLLSKGADTSLSSWDGVSPLLAAARSGATPLVQMLLECGAQPDKVRWCWRWCWSELRAHCPPPHTHTHTRTHMQCVQTHAGTFMHFLSSAAAWATLSNLQGIRCPLCAHLWQASHLASLHPSPLHTHTHHMCMHARARARTHKTHPRTRSHSHTHHFISCACLPRPTSPATPPS